MATISEALTIAIEHHQGGRLQAAQQIYWQILQVEPNHHDALHHLGMLAYQVGKLEIAVEYMGRALQQKPDNAEAHYNLGNALRKQGNLDEAIACYRRALALKPDFAEAHSNLGNGLKEQGNMDQAVACYRRALALKPDFAEAHYNLGVALKDQGNLGEAVGCYLRALALKPDFAEAHADLASFAQAHYNLGNTLKDQGKLEEAVSSYRQAVALKPDFTEAYNNLGNTLKDQGKLDEAVSSYRRTLALKPDLAEACYNLGNALKNQGNLDEAAVCYRQALARKPDYAEAHNNLGVTLNDQGKLDEAVACYRQALALKPDYAEAHYNLGLALSAQGTLDEAAVCYQQALVLKPDYAEAHWNQSLLMLLTGDFEHGWAEYEWRWKTNEQDFEERSFSQPLWDGQPLAGRTILVHAEQGLGDSVQFVRYLPLVKQRGGTVIFECPRPLVSLLASCAGSARVVGRGDELPAFDVQAPLLSLPGIFHTTLEDIPAAIPYLVADPGLVEHWQRELSGSGRFKIGIAWQGSPKHRNDRARSIPPGCFEPLARCSGTRLLSLQKGMSIEQLQQLAERFPVSELGSRLESFVDTAAVMLCLDLVITCDTAVAHLAGALGVPVWVALPFVPDWRWLVNRSDSPWYPTMRLFRQDRPGNWTGVFERIAAALRILSSRLT